LNNDHSAKQQSAATPEASLDIAPIQNRRDCRRALKEIDAVMNAVRNTAEGDRLDMLVTLVETWEAKHWRFDPSDAP
jgi:HTH-type transcriptional regulator / antitoxin HigA